MKYAIVVGHHAGSHGAAGTKGACEYDVNLLLGMQIVRGLPGSRLFVHTPEDTVMKTLRPTIEAINEFDPDAVVELHWNAAVSANGARSTFFWEASLAVVWHMSTNGRALGAVLSAACAEALGTDDMGVVSRDSGYPMLRDVKAPSVLLETHNGLDGLSHEAFLNAVADGMLAFAIGKALMGWRA